MSTPPAKIPEQPWQYPPAHRPGESQPPTIGGYYTRGEQGAVPTNRADAPPIWHGQKNRTNGKAVAAFILAALGVAIVLFFTMIEAGFSGTVVGAIVALVPLTVVLSAVWWLDRWEPEPRLYLFLSFAWGAGVAAATAMYLNTKAFAWLSASIADPAAVELLGVSFIAPVTEELLKSAALLLIFVRRRRLINSAVDLVVYAAVIASGFAFTENVLYFARGSSVGALGAVFFGRAVMSPFAHIMFTSATALILATVLYAKRKHLLWAYPLGTAIAVVLHGLWNFTAAASGPGFLTVFMWLHVPIFGLFLATVILLRRRERRHIVTRLTEYGQAGWFAPHEVAMLGSLQQRSQARVWAKQFGVRAAEAMAEFQSHATLLALNRRHMAHAARRESTDMPQLLAEEGLLLEQLREDRERFLHAAGPGAVSPAPTPGDRW